MEKGKVWLVGAGPGDTELLTVKAKKVIENADVVVYDRLVGQGILMMIPEQATCIDVGKRAGNHTMPQEEINQVLVREALAGRKVVRLKGGDPFLFGRGGEELELLSKLEIPYEIVPGITSAIAVPAYNGIPVTHRDFCSSVHIITGHRGKDEPYDIDFEALVRTQGTLVFLMGVSALPDICQGLLEAGMDSATPAAILQKGTTSRQKRIVATIATLEKEVKKQGIETPAIIVVGQVCELAEEFFWFEKLPLFGKKILVTRPKELSSSLSEKLRKSGAEVLEVPAVKTVAMKENLELLEALRDISKYQWLVFTSPSGVTVFFDFLLHAKVDIRKLGTIRIAAIGQGTKKKIEERGLLVDYMPETYDGKSLGELIGNKCSDGDRILIPRARIANPELVEEIEKQKRVIIDDIATYDTVFQKQHIVDLKQEFEEGAIDYAVFTSSSIVRAFVNSTEGLDYQLVTAVCIGKQTQEEANNYQMKTICAKEATMESLVTAVEELAGKKEGLL